METITGYKAFDKNWKCRNFQFEVGKEYEEKGEIEICQNGFHFCKNPLDTLSYYSPIDSNFAEVETKGNTRKHDIDSKIVSNKIKIKSKLKLFDLIKIGVKFIQRNIKATTGDYAHAATTGDSAHAATTGDSAHAATTGNYAHAATTGDYAHAATTGNYAHAATTGDYAHAATTGDDSIAVAVGINNVAKAALNNWLVLSEWSEENKLICVKSIKVDGKKIKADTWYKLQNKKFIEVKE